MDIELRACRSLDELRTGLDAIGHYFGFENSEEDAERFAHWLDLERMHVALEAGQIVAGAGAFSFGMSVPGGGSVPAAGVTAVGVLPTHRRRGILTRMMHAQLEECRARGDLAAFLWASESPIYTRFGYGLASRQGEAKLARERTAFARPFTPRGAVRLVDLEEAARTFPPLYERAFAQRPGMFSRSKEWWETRTLLDDPLRRKGAPKNLALLELGGEPAGYAIYSVKQDWAGGSSAGVVTIRETVAPTPEATRELWRWLFDFDWTSEFHAGLLPTDHELFLLLAEPRRLRFRIDDGVWLRLVDVEGALTARSYNGAAGVVLEVTDALLPENDGRYRVGAGGAERTDAAADLALAVGDLGSVYLGGFSFGELARAGRVEELGEGAVQRADALFRTAAAPWCPEIF